MYIHALNDENETNKSGHERLRINKMILTKFNSETIEKMITIARLKYENPL